MTVDPTTVAAPEAPEDATKNAFLQKMGTRLEAVRSKVDPALGALQGAAAERPPPQPDLEPPMYEDPRSVAAANSLDELVRIYSMR